MDNSKKITLSVILLLLPLAASAETLSGLVMDSLQRPVPFASVFVKGCQRAVATRFDGSYELTTLPPGEYDVTYSHVGYATECLSIKIAKGKDLTVNVVLQEQPIVLGEAFVVNGSIEDFLLNRVAAVKPLSEQMAQCRASVSCRIESLGDLPSYPSELRNLLRFFMGLSGYKKIFTCMENHPSLIVTVQDSVALIKGKFSLAGNSQIASTPTLGYKEETAFLNKKWNMATNHYDALYNLARQLKKSNLQSKKKGHAPQAFYAGSYHDTGRTIHILRCEQSEFHIVDGCWQIYRYTEWSDRHRKSIQTEEMLPSVYLPFFVHEENSFDLDAAKEQSWSWAQTLSYCYEK